MNTSRLYFIGYLPIFNLEFLRFLSHEIFRENCAFLFLVPFLRSVLFVQYIKGQIELRPSPGVYEARTHFGEKGQPQNPNWVF